MLEPADPASGLDRRPCSGTLLDGATQRGVLLDPEVRPVLVVVDPVLRKQAPKMLLVENDDVVGATRKGWSGGRK